MSAPQEQVTRVSRALWGEDRQDITWYDIADGCEALRNTIAGIDVEQNTLRADRDALAARVAELEHIINDAEKSVFLMTAAEWENLSPESRHKINVNINVDRKRLERAEERVERLEKALGKALSNEI